jgi:hypothetical protein
MAQRSHRDSILVKIRVPCDFTRWSNIVCTNIEASGGRVIGTVTGIRKDVEG